VQPATRSTERDVERDLAVAVSLLRGVLAIVIVICGAAGLLVWSRAHQGGYEAAGITWPLFAGAGVSAVLWLLASRAPLVTGVIGLVAVVGDGVRALVTTQVIGAGLVVRVVTLAAFALVVHAAVVARRARA